MYCTVVLLLTSTFLTMNRTSWLDKIALPSPDNYCVWLNTSSISHFVVSATKISHAIDTTNKLNSNGFSLFKFSRLLLLKKHVEDQHVQDQESQMIIPVYTVTVTIYCFYCHKMEIRFIKRLIYMISLNTFEQSKDMFFYNYIKLIRKKLNVINILHVTHEVPKSKLIFEPYIKFKCFQYYTIHLKVATHKLNPCSYTFLQQKWLIPDLHTTMTVQM